MHIMWTTTEVNVKVSKPSVGLKAQKIGKETKGSARKMKGIFVRQNYSVRMYVGKDRHMTLGVIGKKVGMTQIFDSEGLAVPVTVIKVDPIVVTQVKTVETDGYNAIQVGTIAAKEKHLTKAQIGHFKKNNLENYRHLQEFRVDDASAYTVGQQIELSV